MQLPIKPKATKILVTLLLTLQSFTVSHRITYSSTSSFGPTEYVTTSTSEQQSSGFTTGGSISIGSGSTGTITEDDITLPQDFTITIELLNFINAIRGQSDVVPQIQPTDDGTFDITVQTTQGTKSIKGISKNALSVFILLFKNPSLNIKTLSQSGINVNIEVEPSVSGTTSNIQLDSKTLDIIKQIEANPNLKVTKVTQSGDDYTIVFSDGTTTETVVFPKEIALFILNKVQHPNTDIQVQPNPDGSATVQMPQIPKDQTALKVGKLLLEILNLVRQNPSSKIHVVPTGNTFTLEITINGVKKTFPNLSSTIIHIFTTLTQNLSLWSKVTVGKDGHSMIVFPSTTGGKGTVTTRPSDFVHKLHNCFNNPHYAIATYHHRYHYGHLGYHHGSHEQEHGYGGYLHGSHEQEHGYGGSHHGSHEQEHGYRGYHHGSHEQEHGYRGYHHGSHEQEHGYGGYHHGSHELEHGSGGYHHGSHEHGHQGYHHGSHEHGFQGYHHGSHEHGYHHRRGLVESVGHTDETILGD